MQFHFTKSLYNFKGVKVINSWFSKHNFIILLKESQTICECPCCHSLTSKVHDHKKQNIKDVPLQSGTPTTLVLDKIRYQCKQCGHTFYNSFDFLPKNYSITTRLIAHIRYLFEKKLPNLLFFLLMNLRAILAVINTTLLLLMVKNIRLLMFYLLEN